MRLGYFSWKTIFLMMVFKVLLKHNLSNAFYHSGGIFIPCVSPELFQARINKTWVIFFTATVPSKKWWQGQLLKLLMVCPDWYQVWTLLESRAWGFGNFSLPSSARRIEEKKIPSRPTPHSSCPFPFPLRRHGSRSKNSLLIFPTFELPKGRTCTEILLSGQYFGEICGKHCCNFCIRTVDGSKKTSLEDPVTW